METEGSEVLSMKAGVHTNLKEKSFEKKEEAAALGSASTYICNVHDRYQDRLKVWSS